MRINLVPQRKEFFELYSQSSANLVEISELLVRYLERFPGDGADLVRDIKSSSTRATGSRTRSSACSTGPS